MVLAADLFLFEKTLPETGMCAAVFYTTMTGMTTMITG
jgi:hypothetical protein